MASSDRALMDVQRPSVAAMLSRQVVYQLKVLVRSPVGSFATLVIPLMILLAVNLLFMDTRLPGRGNIRFVQFFTPAMVAFAVVNCCYMSVISSTTLARDEGILKRVRSTPLPSWIYMAGRVVSAGAVAVTSAIVVLAVGAGVYGFRMIWVGVPAALLTLVVAMFCFCSLGLAVTVLVPKADSALPVAWGTILPFCFVSDVFQPIDRAPQWLRTVASAFPLRPFADDLEAAFNPVTGSGAIHPGHLLLVAAWGAGSLMFALVAFRWEPGGRRAGGEGTQRLPRAFAPDRLGELVVRRAAAAPTRTTTASPGEENGATIGEGQPDASRPVAAAGAAVADGRPGRGDRAAPHDDSSGSHEP